MDLWADAVDSMIAIENTPLEDMSLDQRLQLAQIKALLSISQELSKIHHEGVNPEYSVGD